jgi:hypothetical protein
VGEGSFWIIKRRKDNHKAISGFPEKSDSDRRLYWTVKNGYPYWEAFAEEAEQSIEKQAKQSINPPI